MDWGNLGRKLAAAGFPVLGGAVGGPVGAAIGATVAAKLGVDPTPDAVSKMILADPNSAIALRQIEAQMQADQNATDTKQSEIEAEDRQNARAVTNGHWLTPVLTLVLIAMVVALGFGLFIVEPPQANRDLVNVLLGNVMGWAGAGVVYWLGSSRGSADRAATIDKIARQK